MDIRPRITYKPEPFQLLLETQKVWLRQLAPHNIGQPFPRPNPLTVLKAPWEGGIILPSPGRPMMRGYGNVLTETIRVCKPILESHGVRLDTYVDPEKIRLAHKTWRRTNVTAQRNGWISGQFQLGRKFGAVAPADVRLQLESDEIALDPASVLIIITMAVMEHGISALQPMWIDCPGAEYDPEGKKKFSDCPRWNVSTDPSDKDAAFLSLDWNWSANLRARANHGSATMLLEP